MTRIIDVGCGPGIWVDALNQMAHIEAIGIDTDRFLPDKDYLHRVDIFSEEFDKYNNFDIAICFEVAEHIPEKKADEFITKLCQTAPIIYFTAAQPDQGGWGHINEQPPSYWENKFNENNYILDPEETQKIKDYLSKGIYMGWMMNNIQVFKNYGSMYYDTISNEEIEPARHLALYF